MTAPARLAIGLVVAALLAGPACGTGPATPGQNSPSHADVLATASVWLRGAAVPFDRVDPADSLDDLEPLRQIVGDARIVSLGEATHGTREFFQVKHRILRFLVERMGFTAFAIEATWPEANRLDRYVRTGEGDPAALLSGLYFWTWNTDEVLELIRWMRRHNEAGGNVGFYGFDMQAPGMALDNVVRFIAAVDPGASAEVAQHIDCLARYSNDWTGRSPSPGYADQPLAYRDACLQDLRWVQALLDARRAAYESASSPSQWSRAVQSARVAVQYEGMSSKRRSRDLAMADNAGWLLDQLPAGGKIVLWAHNGHVSASTTETMGGALRSKFGAAMVVMGFSFAEGSFNAIGVSGSSYTPAGPHRINAPKYDSYEEYFLAGGMPRFFLDLRTRAARADTPSWLIGPRNALSIGAVYADASPDTYYYQARLLDEYDVMIFLDKTSPSVLLPFHYPPSF